MSNENDKPIVVKYRNVDNPWDPPRHWVMTISKNGEMYWWEPTNPYRQQ